MGLFEDFNKVSYEEWLTKIKEDLKGKDFNTSLIWNSEEGIKVQPIYTKKQLDNNFSKTYSLTTNNSPWEIRDEIRIENNFKEANKRALNALKGGANNILFIGEVNTQKEMDILLSGITTNIISVNFYTPYPNKVKKYFTANSKLSIQHHFYYDYLGELLINGNWINNDDRDQKLIYEAPNLIVKGIYYSNSGANIIQEIAYSLSQAVEYIDILTENGLTAKEAINKIEFNLGINTNYFFEIAKLRAFKILWNLITAQYNVKTNPIIHANTSNYHIAAKDVETNILRTTTEAMSAILGGCDSLCITPFNTLVENPNDFSCRIARNIQILLKEESYFDKVNDPSKGAYYIENLTDKFVNQSLDLFKQIETKGGYFKLIKTGELQKEILNTHQKRLEKYLNNEKTLLGVNKYPNTLKEENNDIPENKISYADNTIIQPLLQFNLGKEISNKITLHA